MSSVALLEWSYLPTNLIGSAQKFEALGASFVIQNGSARAQMDESTFRLAPGMKQKLLAVIKARVAPFEHLASASLDFRDRPALTITHDDGRPTEIHLEAHAGIRIADYLHFQVIDKNGVVTFDSELDQLASAEANAELLARHATDDVLSRLLLSLAQSRKDRDNEFTHLYEILEALAARFGSNHNICGALGINLPHVRDFHRICNTPSTVSRHRGLAKSPLAEPDPAQYSFARSFAWELVMAYGSWLEGPR